MKTKQQLVQRRGKKLSWRRVIVIVAIVLLLAAAILWVLNIEQIIQGDWSSILSIVFTVLGVIFAFCQWLYPFSSEDTQEPSTPPTARKANSQRLLDEAKKDYNKHRYTQALSAYHNVLELDPDCEEAYHGLGLILLKFHSFENAFKDFEIAERLHNRYRERETTVPNTITSQRTYRTRTSVIVESAGASVVDGKIYRDHKSGFVCMQDTLYTGEAFGLFGVACSTSIGDSEQETNSSLAIQAVINYIVLKIKKKSLKEMENDVPKTILYEGIQHANRLMLQQQKTLATEMKIAMTVALIIGDTIYIAQVGENRAYLYRREEGLIKITQDDVSAVPAERDVIVREDITSYQKQKQPSFRMSDQSSIHVDLYAKTLELNDKLLLCSNSLWHRLSDQDIQQTMSTSMVSLGELVETLIQATSNGAHKVITTVVMLYVVERTKNIE